MSTNSPDPEPVTEPAPGTGPIPEPEPAVGPTDRTGPGRTRPGHGNGYLASMAGALVGAASGSAVGLLVGPVAFRYASHHLDLSPKHLDHGLAGALEDVMIAVSIVIMAALLAALLVVLCVWVASVLGCGLALRVRGHDGARRTALTFGALLPATFLTLAFVVSRFGRITGATAEVFYSIAVGLAAYLARRLTLWRPEPPGQDPDRAEEPEVSGPPRETRRGG